MKIHLLCTSCRLIQLVILIVLIQSSAFALGVPPLSGRVVDRAAILDESTEALLSSRLEQLERTDSTQLVIYTLRSLQGENLEQYSLKVAETWKLGQKDVDNGVLLLIAVDDRKLRIEVGYGLEGVLTDMMSGRIIRNIIVPEFRKGQYAQGIMNGVDALIKTVQGEYTAENLPVREQKKDPGGLVIAALFGLFFIGSAFRKRKLLGGIAGGLFGGMLWLTSTFISGLLMLFIMIPVGALAGVIATSLFAQVSSRSGGAWTHGGYTRGGWGGGSIGGGFGGGGGGFGGGGASGGW